MMARPTIKIFRAVVNGKWLLTLTISLIFFVGPSVVYENTKNFANAQSNNSGRTTAVYGFFLAALEAERNWDMRKAANLFVRVMEDKPDDEELMRKSFKVALLAGMEKLSLDLGERLENEGYNDNAAKFLLLIRSVHEEKFEEVLKSLPDVKESGIAAYATPIVAAWAAYGRNDVDGALSYLSQLTDGDGFRVLRGLQEGLINDLANRPMEAEEAYRSIVQGPANAPVRAIRAIGSFLERQGRAEEAKEFYNSYLSKNPGSDLFELELQRIANGQSGKLMVSNPAEGIAEGFYHLASAVPIDRGAELAMVYTRLSLVARPNFALSKLLVGRLLTIRKRYSEAMEMYNSIESASPYYWTARLRVANNLYDLDNLDGAVRLLNTLAAERKNRPEPFITQGDLLRFGERFRDAVQSYNKAFSRIDRVESSHWNLYYSRGVALERIKLWKRAEEDFLKALELEPDQPFVLNYLGYSWVEQGRNLIQAREMIEKAVSQRSDDGYMVDSLGWVLYRLGEWKKAVYHLERAVELRPQDAVINDHLGDALWRVNRRNEAKFQWRRALTLKPDVELVNGIKTKLKDGLAKPGKIKLSR